MHIRSQLKSTTTWWLREMEIWFEIWLNGTVNADIFLKTLQISSTTLYGEEKSSKVFITQVTA